MHFNWLRKITSVSVATAHLLVSVFMFMPSISHAQAVDVDPPVIELEVVDEGVIGDTQVFSASLSDDNAISSMTLHYRFGDAAVYISVPMSPIVGTSIYTASVDTTDAPVNVIQYYMEARDTGGNRTVQGFAFDPFERVLVEDAAAIAPTAAAGGTSTTGAVAGVVPTLPTAPGRNRNIVFGVAAAVLLGGLLAAGSSSSSGGDSPEPAAAETDLTIIVDNFNQ